MQIALKITNDLKIIYIHVIITHVHTVIRPTAARFYWLKYYSIQH